MHQYRLGFAAPDAASVPVVTDQFLFFQNGKAYLAAAY
jgi:hypothetical protein